MRPVSRQRAARRRLDALVVEHGYGDDLQPERPQPLEDCLVRLVHLRGRQDRGPLDAGGAHLRHHVLQLVRVGRGVVAEDDGVGAAQHAEQRAAAAPVFACACDEPRNLDQLHEHAADARQCRHRPRGRERVVARLDLNVGQRLQQRGLPRVRRADERDLGGALAPHRDRVAVDDTRASARFLELRVHPLADVRVRAAPIAG